MKKSSTSVLDIDEKALAAFGMIVSPPLGQGQGQQNTTAGRLSKRGRNVTMAFEDVWVPTYKMDRQ
jgi:hypothetical protein